MIRLSVTVPAATLELDKRALKRALMQAGREVAKDARRLIRTSPASGRLYRGPGGSAKYRGAGPGLHRASSPNQAPASDSGTLLRSIGVKPFQSGEGVRITDSAFYALFLEAGARGGGRLGPRGAKRRGKAGISKTRVLEPRPFLTTSLQSREQSLGPRLLRAMAGGISLKVVK